MMYQLYQTQADLLLPLRRFARIGASLARLEVRVVLEELLARVGAMRVAGPVAHAGSNFSNGIFSLPLELEPA